MRFGHSLAATFLPDVIIIKSPGVPFLPKYLWREILCVVGDSVDVAAPRC